MHVLDAEFNWRTFHGPVTLTISSSMLSFLHSALIKVTGSYYTFQTVLFCLKRPLLFKTDLYWSTIW